MYNNNIRNSSIRRLRQSSPIYSPTRISHDDDVELKKKSGLI